MLRQLKATRKLATTLCLASVGLIAAFALFRGGHLAEAAPAASIAAALPRIAGRVEASRGSASINAWRRQLEWSRVRADADGYVQLLRDGGRVELTLDPALQHHAERALAAAPSRYASAVVISVDDGRVLALAGRSSAEPRKSPLELATTAWAPAASVFKLVTATALVEAGLSPETRVCYHDGVHSIEPSNLTPHPRWDTSCASLGYGVAKSQNAIIARLAHDHLDAGALERTARAFGFGAAIPFELPVSPSQVSVPSPSQEPLQFARVAAGFWQTTLSTLHGAWLAATLARGGVTPPLRLVDRVVARDGSSERPAVAPERRVVSAEAARTVARMMVGTTEFGTARLGFHDRQGHPILPVEVAGKTGSLNRAQPFLGYSWFVGFAPAERPEVAVAVLLGNGEHAGRRAHQVAAELLSGYFHGAPALPARRLASR